MKNGWQTKKLGEVCEVVNGGTPKTGVKEYWDGEFHWITPAEMGKRESPYVDQTERRITENGLKNSSAKLLPPKSVILSSRAPIGHLVINTLPMSTNQGCKGLIPCENLKHKYLFYYLGSKVELLNELGSGATFKELSGGKLKEVLMPLPPLPEQQRIVAILDKAFEGIATAKANAEKNLNNARELFNAHVERFFFSNEAGCEKKRLADVVSELVTGPFGSMLHKSDYVDDGIPIVNPQNIIGGKIVPLKKTMVSKQTRKRMTRFCLREKDIVIARRGEMGRCGIVDKTHVGWLCGTGSMVIRLKDNVNEQFITLLLQSSTARKRLERDAVGTTMSNLNQDILLGVKFHMPPVRTQETIIAKLDALSAETKKLESIYRQKLTALEELKKSVLQKAFTGGLA